MVIILSKFMIRNVNIFTKWKNKLPSSEKSPQAAVGNGTADRFVFIRYLNALQ